MSTIKVDVKFDSNIDEIVQKLEKAVESASETLKKNLLDRGYEKWRDLAGGIANPRIRQSYLDGLQRDKHPSQIGLYTGYPAASSSPRASTGGPFFPLKWETGIVNTVVGTQVFQLGQRIPMKDASGAVGYVTATDHKPMWTANSAKGYKFQAKVESFIKTTALSESLTDFRDAILKVFA